MKQEMVTGVQPAVIQWARESTGLSVLEVAKLMKRPADEIQSWEDGDAAPTYRQLEKLAYSVLKRPLAVFFLPKPPEEEVPSREFRTLPKADLQNLQSDTYLQIRKAHAFQLSLKDVFDERNPSSRCIWKDISLTEGGSITDQAEQIRAYLRVSITDQVSWKGDETALKQWREAIEEAGVFVFKASFKQKDLCGFCLQDTEFPIIYLNNGNTKTRQAFSLFHELAHILFNVSGISKKDQEYLGRLPSETRRIERFCNAVSAEILIPRADFLEQAGLLPANVEQAGDGQFAQLADRYGVSREAILRRFLDMQRVSSAFYARKASLWSSQASASGGGDWYSNQNTYLSRRFAQEVVKRQYRQQFTVEQAADYLGVSPKNYSGLELRILKSAA